jgi:hypothetical protein
MLINLFLKPPLLGAKKKSRFLSTRVKETYAIEFATQPYPVSTIHQRLYASKYSEKCDLSICQSSMSDPNLGPPFGQRPILFSDLESRLVGFRVTLPSDFVIARSGEKKKEE